MTSIEGLEEGTREAKRRRQWDDTATTESPAQPSTAAAVVIAPDVAGSRSPTTGDTHGPPTALAVSKQLCLLDLAGGGTTMARDDAVRALEALSNWAIDTDDSAFLKHFQIYAGTPRVLDFLKKNMGDLNLVESVCYLLAWCLSSGNTTDQKAVATQIRQSLVDLQGIQTLLLANDECSATNTEAAIQIWTCLKTVTSQSPNITAINPEEKEQAILVTDAACDWLTKISTTHTAFLTTSFLFLLLGTLSTQLEVSLLEPQDIQRRAVVPAALKCLLHVEGSWKHDESCANTVVSFFCECGVLTGSQYQDLIPFYIKILKSFPLADHITSWVILFLEGASSNVDKGILKNAGVCVALAKFDISGAPNDEWMRLARELGKKLFED
jgi:hypothetical protein